MSMASGQATTLAERLALVQEQIRAAAHRAQRDSAEITLVAVSKTHPFERIEEALAAGQVDFGENRLEELWEKVQLAQARGAESIRWHAIGTIQSRKSKDAVGPFALIHAVDRLKIARRLDRDAGEAGQRLAVLLEVNTSGEESKHGFSPDDLKASMPELLKLSHLDYRGLMTMAPFVEDPEETRPCFRALRELLDWLRQAYPAEKYPNVEWQHLSMGMSNDFEVAIEEGATLVRVGTAIFGERG
jgi:pyridoxal phosphate enzyme (YggS family)